MASSSKLNPGDVTEEGEMQARMSGRGHEMLEKSPTLPWEEYLCTHCHHHVAENSSISQGELSAELHPGREGAQVE